MSDNALCIRPFCGGEDGPRPAGDGTLICRGCTTRLRRDIACTPALVRWLTQHKTPGSGGADRVSGSRDAATPVRLDVLSMINEGATPIHGDDDDQIGPPSIPSTLKNWTWYIAEYRGLVYPLGATVEQLAQWLERHVDWAVTKPFVADMMTEIGRLRRAAHALAPWTLHVQEMTGPCPSCDKRTLVRVSGETYIECDADLGGCGDLWSWEEYHGRVTELSNAKTHRGVA